MPNLFFLYIFANENNDVSETITGGAGWFGCGLLGLVLYWLFFRYLPAKDRQIRELIKIKDDQTDSLLKKFDTMLTQTRDDFKVSLDTIASYNQQSNSAFSKIVQLELSAIGKSLERLAVVVVESKKAKKKDENA